MQPKGTCGQNLLGKNGEKGPHREKPSRNESNPESEKWEEKGESLKKVNGEITLPNKGKMAQPSCVVKWVKKD